RTDLDRRGRADHAHPAADRADLAAAFADAASARAGAGRLRPASTGRVLGAAPPRWGRAIAGRGQSDGRRGGRREGGPPGATSRPHRGAGVAGMEPVFRTLEIAAQAAMRATGTRITYHGLENIPASGGAVIAINHTSYIDFLPAALAVHNRNRRMR